jgi:iron complex outermembrane receptor protein
MALTPYAMAQDVGDEEIEEVVVTATGTAIRGVAPVGAATVSMNHEDMLNQTSVDTTSFIRDLPQGSGFAQQEVQNTGGNVGFAQGINLRGLGNNATLVLFDGNRLVGQGVTSQFADPNQLPISAIERVEVVMDAASAVYGSDAIAGVVNFILRDNFEGFEVNARYTDSLYQSAAIDMLGGLSWGSGNAWVGVMFEDRGTFRNSERGYLLEDLTPYGGNDNRISGTSARPGPLPHIVANDTIYGVPDTGGAIPTAQQILDMDGNFTLSDRGEETDYWSERERLALSFRASQDIGDRMNLRLTGVYSERKSDLVQFVDERSSVVRDTSPYWIDGITTDTSYRMVYSYYWNNQGPGSVEVVNKAREESLNMYLDYTWDITDNWQLKANYTYGDTEGCGRCGRRENFRVADAGYVDSAQTDPPGYSDIFNPFVTGPQTEFFNLVYGAPQNQQTWFTMNRARLVMEGGLFELPGGDVRVAFGGEYEDTTNKLLLDGEFGRSNPPGPFVLRDTESDRQIAAAFVEAYFPILENLAVNVALRHDDYSDFGSTTNPRIGINWAPVDSLTLRATAAEAFRAPTLVETDPGILEQIRRRSYSNDGSHDIPVTDPLSGTTAVLDRIGNTPGLQPETAEMWTVGFDWYPEFAEGLRISMTYYDVAYDNRIEALPNQTAAISSAENRALYDPYVTVQPQPATCVEGDLSTYDPFYQEIMASPNYGVGQQAPINECDLQGTIRGGTQNTGKLNQSGIDLQVSYDWSTDIGDWGVRFNGAKITDLTRSLLPGGEAVEQLDRIGFQNSFRAVTRGIWRNDNWYASIDWTHVGDYLNDQPITVGGVRQPESTVPSWNIYGADLAYEIPKGTGSGLLDGFRVGLSVDNLTDEQPPIVLWNDTAVDFANHNVFGRIWSVTLQKQFGQ